MVDGGTDSWCSTSDLPAAGHPPVERYPLAVHTRSPAGTHCLPLLNHLARVGAQAADGILAPTGLRPRHLVALIRLVEHGPTSQRGLAASLALDPTNVVGLLNELEDRGLVARRRDAADRRRHIVEVSDEGRVALTEAQHRLPAVEDHLLGALSEAERETLHDLLARAVDGYCAEATGPRSLRPGGR